MKNIHDVDKENVYRTCIGGSTRVQDVHRRKKIRYEANPRPVHDREPDVDRPIHVQWLQVSRPYFNPNAANLILTLKTMALVILTVGGWRALVL